MAPARFLLSKTFWQCELSISDCTPSLTSYVTVRPIATNRPRRCARKECLSAARAPTQIWFALAKCFPTSFRETFHSHSCSLRKGEKNGRIERVLTGTADSTVCPHVRQTKRLTGGTLRSQGREREISRLCRRRTVKTYR
ncbi:unnamed protein product [Ixodes persulcatus]